MDAAICPSCARPVQVRPEPGEEICLCCPCGTRVRVWNEDGTVVSSVVVGGPPPEVLQEDTAEAVCSQEPEPGISESSTSQPSTLAADAPREGTESAASEACLPDNDPSQPAERWARVSVPAKPNVVELRCPVCKARIWLPAQSARKALKCSCDTTLRVRVNASGTPVELVEFLPGAMTSMAAKLVRIQQSRSAAPDEDSARPVSPAAPAGQDLPSHRQKLIYGGGVGAALALAFIGWMLLAPDQSVSLNGPAGRGSPSRIPDGGLADGLPRIGQVPGPRPRSQSPAAPESQPDSPQPRQTVEMAVARGGPKTADLAGLKVSPEALQKRWEEISVPIPPGTTDIAIDGDLVELQGADALFADSSRPTRMVVPSGRHTLRCHPSGTVIEVDIKVSFVTAFRQILSNFVSSEGRLALNALVDLSAVSLDSDVDPFMGFLWGNYYAAGNRLAAAERHYQSAIAAAPAFAPAYLALAHIQVRNHQREAANRSFQIARALNWQNAYGLDSKLAAFLISATPDAQSSAVPDFAGGLSFLPTGEVALPEQQQRVIDVLGTVALFAAEPLEQCKVLSNMGAYLAWQQNVPAACIYWRRALRAVRQNRAQAGSAAIAAHIYGCLADARKGEPEEEEYRQIAERILK